METKQEYTLEQRLKAVALFDEWKNSKLHNNYPIKDFEGADYYYHKRHLTIYVANYFQDKHWTTQLEYNTSWNWLMPIVDKILKINGFNFYHKKFGIIVTKGIDYLFKLVSDFCIEWCNENNIKID